MTTEPSKRDAAMAKEPPDRVLWFLWRQGQRPDLESFLGQLGPLSADQVVAVQAVDQWERWQIGERVPAEVYLTMQASLGVGATGGLDIVYGEYLLREQAGEAPPLEEFARRFPQHAAALERQIEVHHAMQASAAGSLGGQGPPRVVAAATPPAIAGLTLPGYTLLEEIGRGSMGVVYKARQIHLNRTVAIKVVRPEQLVHPVAIHRLQREAQASARLLHPNLVTVHDAGIVDNTFYMVMEYVTGVDLHRLVQRDGPLTVAQACDYLRQAALGLQHAWEHNIVHRDIKPSNLMITQPDASTDRTRFRPLLKILDMGLARMQEPLRADGDTGPLTQEGVFLGTPDFVAPEQGEDSRKVDIRADLYSLGCTFYYLLTGVVPFPNCSSLEKLFKHRLSDPIPVEALRPDLPAGLAALLRRLMAKRPEERFQTPADLAEAAAGVKPMTAETPPLIPRERPAEGMPSTRTRGALSTVNAPQAKPRGQCHCLTGHTDWVKSVSVSPSGDQLASAGIDGTVRLWDLTQGVEQSCFTNHRGAVLWVAFRPDGKMLASGGVDQSIRLQDAATGRELQRLLGHTDQVNSVVFNRDGTRLLSASHDRTLRLWDVATGQELACLQGHEEAVWNAAFLPEERQVVSCSRDRTLRVWSLASGKVLQSLTKPTTHVLCVAVAPEGQLVASGNADATLSVWDLDMGREVRVLMGHGSRVTSVVFAAADQRLLSGSRDGTLALWDARTGIRLLSLEGHTNWITSVALSPDGLRAISGSTDTTVRVWDLGS